MFLSVLLKKVNGRPHRAAVVQHESRAAVLELAPQAVVERELEEVEPGHGTRKRVEGPAPAVTQVDVHRVHGDQLILIEHLLVGFDRPEGDGIADFRCVVSCNKQCK